MKMIYYYPQEIIDKPKKGSELRPKEMLNAFKKRGYIVDEVTGESKERKRKIKQVLSNVENGIKYDFMYAESTNMPIPISDYNHFPTRPLIDFKFFKKLRKNNIPIGLFYRDVYWREENLKNFGSIIKVTIKNIFHWFEWYLFSSTVSELFLPTNNVANYLPSGFSKDHMHVLPPGFNSATKVSYKENKKSSSLRAIYVGGVTPPYYDLRNMLKLVSEKEYLKLYLCCREDEWNENYNYYKDVLSEDIDIIHEDSKSIIEYYRKSDFVLEAREAIGYFKNAFPIKIMEAIGNGLPLLLLRGSVVSDFIEENDFGWVVDDIKMVGDKLDEIYSQDGLISEVQERIMKNNDMHFWEARVDKVNELLSNENEA